jgi:hypothetical protein
MRKIKQENERREQERKEYVAYINYYKWQCQKMVDLWLYGIESVTLSKSILIPNILEFYEYADDLKNYIDNVELERQKIRDLNTLIKNPIIDWQSIGNIYYKNI